MSEHLGFQYLSREELLERARALGMRRPELLTKAELQNEIVRLSNPEPRTEARESGWLLKARHLLANVVDEKLKLGVAARVIRGPETEGPPKANAPVATLTLAEIYASQGHGERALAMLEQILRDEPDHERARTLRERLLRKPHDEWPVAPATPNTSTPYRAETRQTPPVVDTVAEAVETAPPGALTEASSDPKPLEPPAAPALDEDSVTLILRADGEAWVAWTLSSVSAARVTKTGSQVVVRLLAVRPAWDGAKSEFRDLPVFEPRGLAKVEVPSAPTLARAALGAVTDGDFVPLAVAREITSRAGTARVVWAPKWDRAGALTAAEERALEAFRASVGDGVSGPGC